QPSFYRSMASSVAELDGAAAASMISGYRQNNGLGPVALDPALMQMAQTQAQAMAARDKIANESKGEFARRMKAAGFDAKASAENLAAGHHPRAEPSWGGRDPPPHRANMLKAGVSRMGIAAVYQPGSKYKVFWALIMAAPEQS